MSYLNIPRLHFTGQFQADPSTVNNNDANWNRDVQLAEIHEDSSDPTNGAVYWNPNGTHNWQLFGCTVTGVANDQGQFTAPSADPIIGAKVLSNSEYPAKIVDLDPDNQGISQIWGLQIQISIPSPEDPTRVLASMTATMPPTAFCDLWCRVTKLIPGNSTMSAAFQAVLTDVKWENATASPLLSKLQEVSPNSLSIRFIVDSFQSVANQAHFTYGRVVGTIGPVLSTDAPRSTPRRLAPMIPSTPILSSFGAVGAVYDTARSVLILDMGNCVPTSVPTDDSSGTVPGEGWPINPTWFVLAVADPSKPSIAPSIVGLFEVTQSTYLTFAGIVEVPVSPALTYMVQNQPLTLAAFGDVQEDLQGRYVDVDIPFLRMNPGDQSTVTLWATQFGRPWKVDNLDVALQPIIDAANGSPPPGCGPGIGWKNGDPQCALTLSTTTISTQSNGAGTLTLTAADPGTPRKYPNGELGPDGQVYWITGSWANWGQIFLFATAPVNVLVFSTKQIPDNPTWADVGPILSMYTRLCPYMKGIIDLSDYSTVKQNIGSIQNVLNLQKEDPHYMPVMRDLSADKLAIINKWILNGMPE
jgi:hypothetical protein